MRAFVLDWSRMLASCGSPHLGWRRRQALASRRLASTYCFGALGRSGTLCTSPRPYFWWLLGWGMSSNGLPAKDSPVPDHCSALKWWDIFLLQPPRRGEISSFLTPGTPPPCDPGTPAGGVEPLLPRCGSPRRGACVWSRGEALGRARQSPPSVRSGCSLRLTEVETSVGDRASVVWAFDSVMVPPGCPAWARTWTDLLGVDAGPQSLWAFLFLLMKGLGAELITPSLPPRHTSSPTQLPHPVQNQPTVDAKSAPHAKHTASRTS
jgi:hypothetical protein